MYVAKPFKADWCGGLFLKCGGRDTDDCGGDRMPMIYFAGEMGYIGQHFVCVCVPTKSPTTPPATNLKWSAYLTF